MSVELLFAPAKPNNPLEIGKRTLIAALARTQVPHIDVTPDPEQIEAVGEMVRMFAKLFDDWHRDVGLEVKTNATTMVDLSQFEGVFTGAVDGFSTFEITRVAETLRDEIEAESLYA